MSSRPIVGLGFAFGLLALLAAKGGGINNAERVVEARKARGDSVKQLFVDKGLAYPVRSLFLRAFKREGILELWAAASNKQPMVLIKSFSICEKSGELGPKRRRGDLQVPEGVYHISFLQPRSDYHLSLKVNYPNASDRVRGYKKNLGGSIFIHGNCVTIGCLPIEDGPIEELFLAVLDTRRTFSAKVPVHIFPTRLDKQGMDELQKLQSKHMDFWRELQPIYEAFEQDRRVPRTRVDGKTGRYRVQG